MHTLPEAICFNENDKAMYLSVKFIFNFLFFWALNEYEFSTRIIVDLVKEQIYNILYLEWEDLWDS